MKLDKR